MKIGVVSDVHCNVNGLVGALQGMGKVDAVLCAGDTVYGFRFSNQIIDLIRTRNIQMVMGNHDRDFLKIWHERKGSNGYISPENLDFLYEINWTMETEIGGRHIFMTHGSPFDPYLEYMFKHNPKFKRLGDLDVDICILGHTHEALVERVGNVLVVNPGSCGEARNPGAPYLTYAVIDTDTLEASIHRVHDIDQSRGLLDSGDELATGDVDTGV